MFYVCTKENGLFQPLYYIRVLPKFSSRRRMKLSSHQSNVTRRFSAFHTPLARWEGRVWDGDVPLPYGGYGGVSTGKILRFETRKSAFWGILGDDCAMMIHLLIQTHTKKEFQK